MMTKFSLRFLLIIPSITIIKLIYYYFTCYWTWLSYLNVLYYTLKYVFFYILLIFRASELLLNETKEKKRIIENKIIEVEGSLNSMKEQIGKKVSEIKHINKKIITESKSCDEITVEIDNHKRFVLIFYLLFNSIT